MPLQIQLTMRFVPLRPGYLAPKTTPSSSPDLNSVAPPSSPPRSSPTCATRAQRSNVRKMRGD